MKRQINISWLLLLGLMVLVNVPRASAFYDPAAQRWLSRDPISESGGINLFQFAGNMAINIFDPFGLTCPSGYESLGTSDKLKYISYKQIKEQSLTRTAKTPIFDPVTCKTRLQCQDFITKTTTTYKIQQLVKIEYETCINGTDTREIATGNVRPAGPPSTPQLISTVTSPGQSGGTYWCDEVVVAFN